MLNLNYLIIIQLKEKKEKKFNDYWIKNSESRIKKRIPARILMSEKGKYFKSLKTKYDKCKFIESFTPVAVNIYGNDKILIFNYSKPYSCILIYDKNTATSFKNFFNELWKIAKD